VVLAGVVAVFAGLGSAARAVRAQEVRPFVPVLVVPGWYDTGVALAGLRVRLRSAGWPTPYISAVTFADPTGGNVEHAREIGAAVDILLARTGEAQVDIIAHSMGGLATRAYLRTNQGKVRRVVFMATPHRGTMSAYLAFGGGRDEMIPGSPFLDSLNHAPPVPDGVEAITVRTLLDTHILPGSSATLPGVPDHVVCCATHEGLTRDLDAFLVVRGFLRREDLDR
jgi:triacylglycerol lipase